MVMLKKADTRSDTVSADEVLCGPNPENPMQRHGVFIFALCGV
jgi:hypothetical protein